MLSATEFDTLLAAHHIDARILYAHRRVKHSMVRNRLAALSHADRVAVKEYIQAHWVDDRYTVTELR